MRNFTFLSLLTATLIFSGCKENEPVICSDANETAVIEMLSAELDNCTCEISIFRGLFMGQTVYFTRGTDPACLFAYVDPVLYTCEGQSFTSSLIHDPESFNKLVTSTEVLFRCND
jgi:hypothetical protein